MAATKKRGVAYIKIDMQNLSCKFRLLVFNKGVIKFIKPEQNKKEGRKEICTYILKI